jgi:hypothetical protein
MPTVPDPEDDPIRQMIDKMEPFPGAALDPMEVAKQRLREGLGRPDLPTGLLDLARGGGPAGSAFNPEPGRSYNIEDRRLESPVRNQMRNLEDEAYKRLPQFPQAEAAGPTDISRDIPPLDDLGAKLGGAHVPWLPLSEKEEVPWGEKKNVDYNTPIPPELRSGYEQWARELGKNPAEEEADYDLPGFFLATQQNPELLPKGPEDHLPDTFKKPNHPTFSTDSQYSGPFEGAGGQWSKDSKGRDVFTASDVNIRNWGPEGLQKYFEKYEPNATLVIPEDLH